MTDLYLRSTTDKGGDVLRLRSDTDKVPGSVTYIPGFRVQGEGDLALRAAAGQPLRVRKNDVTYGLELVLTTDPNASRVRIRTSAGTRAIRKYTA